jgi:hypothetical protein
MVYMHTNKTKRYKILQQIAKAVIEMVFIIFLFYSNLLMGEYTQSGLGQQHGFAWALCNIFTGTNFVIAVIAALAGYLVFEHLREIFE